MKESNFAATRWTLVRKSMNAGNPEEARRKFSELYGAYCGPLGYFAQSTGLSKEEAAAVVNELFYRNTRELFPIHHPGAELPEIPRDQLPVGLERAAPDATPMLHRAVERNAASGQNFRHFLMNSLRDILRTEWRQEKIRTMEGNQFGVRVPSWLSLANKNFAN
jgi:hypothetical protein